MSVLSKGILRHRKAVLAIFLALAAVSALLAFCVPVRYSLTAYLPEDAESTTALSIMETEFDSGVTNARLMLQDVSIPEALALKQAVQKVPGVDLVLWLDDVVDLKQPLESADPQTVEAYYKDGSALMSLTIAEGNEKDTVAAIRATTGDRAALSGEAVNTANAQETAAREAFRAVAFLLPIILLILLLTSSSWLEPLLFLVTIGISVLINMGTNIFFGEISFITFSISPILQMAVSLDYAIFLLHSFAEYRKQTEDLTQAMVLAMKRAFPAVLASAMTTLFGFLALLFMRFEIGADLGLNLAKGILLSLLSTMVFLPALTLLCHKWVDKTRHRSLMPSFKKAGAFIRRARLPVLILVLLLLAPAYLAQSRNNFSYSTGALDPTSQAGIDNEAITASFGRSMPIVVLVPRGDPGREASLCAELGEVQNIHSVVAYATMVGPEIPEAFLDEGVLSQFYSENYARIVLYADTEAEGDVAFQTVAQVRETARRYYDAPLSCGESVNLYDMKEIISADSIRVNLIAILAIGLVLLLTFRSISLPIVLLLTIETSIWINLSIPYFSGSVINYVGYLVISTVQLGATVDYAILLTDHYIACRRRLPRRAALGAAASETLGSILVSAGILAAAGFIIQLTSTNNVVSELGGLLGRGTLLSAVMVSFFLPALLTFLDPIIEKTSFRLHYFRKETIKK